MAQWAVMISDERLEAERLFHHDVVGVPEPTGDTRPEPGDQVLVLGNVEAPAVVATGRVAGLAPGDRVEPGTLTVTYTRRCFDDPQPADGLPLDGDVTALDPDTFRALADRVAPPPDLRTWLVSVDLPIEADSPAEAVRRFWSYVMELGPRELPAFVSPSDDELAMQAYVLGEEAHLDPEEDDD